MSRLGDTIRAARAKSGLGEKQLAKKCGMAESVIRDIEAGRRIVSDDQARRILKVLGVESPVSTELEVAQEPPAALRPRPRAYVVPVDEPEKVTVHAEEASDAWLDALKDYLRGNVDFMRDYLRDNLPMLKLIEPEGTYLVWVHFSALNMTPGQLHDLVANRARLWLDDGGIFGEPGAQFQRFVLACPRSVLREALDRLKAAIMG